MSRAAYETDDQRAKEDALAAEIAERLELEQYPIGRTGNKGYVYVDRCFHKGVDVKFFAEMKDRRPQTHLSYPTLPLSLQKYERLTSLSSASPTTPVYLMIRYEDGIWYFRIHHVTPLFEVKLFGPKPPRDGADHEPCIVIPRPLFKEFTGKLS